MITLFRQRILFRGLLVLLTGVQFACQAEPEYALPKTDCPGFGFKNITLAELKDSYPGETFRIADSLQWDAVVVSSDAFSNVFGEIYLQDPSGASAGGIVFYTDLLETHAQIPFGAGVRVNLKGLYLGESSGSFELGGAFSTFGNLSVGRLPARLMADHIGVNCDQEGDLIPANTRIPDLSDSLLNTFVKVLQVEFITEEVGLSFAEAGTEVRRTLVDCYGNTLGVKNSGYSDFYSETLPGGHGSVQGILNTYRNRYELVVMHPSEFDFREPRCESRGALATSDSLFISEIADPDNLPQARFLELFNSSDAAIDLNGWELIRYTNANPEPGRVVSLDGLKLEADRTLTFSANPQSFEDTYGFPPDREVSQNGPADSNGDDTVVLVDPFGNVKDVFGSPGTDGSGTDHEFEDGKAERLASVYISDPIYNPLQWRVYNDSGGQGTVKDPQRAPEDFSPGVHPSGPDQKSAQIRKR